MQRRQQAYHRDKEHLSKAEQENYMQYCNEAMLRIHVLEQRLRTHKEIAMNKFKALEEKLLADPRLNILRAKT